MIVHHVLPSIYEEASGPSYSVPALCGALAEAGVDTHLHVLEPLPDRRFSFSVHGYRPGLPPRRLGHAPAMRRGLIAAAQGADILHNHSLWMMPNVYAGRAVHGTRARLVLSPRGTLQPWSLRRHRWRKCLLWLLGQRQTVLRAACIHATAELELHAVRELGLKTPVAVIANGVDIPAARPMPAPGNTKRLLFLGRIHPVKGVDLLIRVWSRIQSRFADWELQIVGPDADPYVAQMRELAAAVGTQRLLFSEPAYGRDKTDLYQKATLYVLPSHTENFGMTVAESLAHGVPVITTKGAPWEGVVGHDCGWWIERTEADLEDCLRHALSLPAETLRSMGQRGRRWMERDFSWSRVGAMMHETYLWMLGGGAAPPWVDTVPQARPQAVSSFVFRSRDQKRCA
jgi:glycosyltransferase involved in cell wall biosynthesis